MRPGVRSGGHGVDTISADGFSAKVFHGERILVLTRVRPEDGVIVRAAASVDEAQTMVDAASRAFPNVHLCYWAWATKVNGMAWPLSPASISTGDRDSSPDASTMEAA